LYKVAKKLDAEERVACALLLFAALLTASWPPALRSNIAVCAICEDFPVFIYRILYDQWQTPRTLA
jgi:hypothetical protein